MNYIKFRISPHRSKCFAVCLIFIMICFTSPSYAETGFEGRLILEPSSTGINMKVLEDFTFTDRSGLTWNVPSGFITDGASVPRALWSFFPPFAGKYLKAAVIHDRYCVTRDRDWRKVHLVFYEAMLAAGVERDDALLMYGGVRAFGPSWDSEGNDKSITFPNIPVKDQEKALEYINKWIIETNPKPEDLDVFIRKSGVRIFGSEAFQ